MQTSFTENLVPKYSFQVAQDLRAPGWEPARLRGDHTGGASPEYHPLGLPTPVSSECRCYYTMFVMSWWWGGYGGQAPRVHY